MMLIALFFGLAVTFSGYRIFLVLLPIWGFFAGFAIGAEALQAIFGEAFLATVTSWIVGFIVGAVFAVLSYLFYIAAVGLFAFSVGYGLGVGVIGLLNLEQFGLLTFVVGAVAGVALAAVTLLLNIQKWVIIAGTAFGGAALIVGSLTVPFLFPDVAQLAQNPVQLVLQNSVFWLVIFLVLGVLGVVGQVRATQDFMLEPYENRI
jgi:hypothetical protein